MMVKRYLRFRMRPTIVPLTLGFDTYSAGIIRAKCQIATIDPEKTGFNGKGQYP